MSNYATKIKSFYNNEPNDVKYINKVLTTIFLISAAIYFIFAQNTDGTSSDSRYIVICGYIAAFSLIAGIVNILILSIGEQVFGRKNDL